MSEYLVMIWRNLALKSGETKTFPSPWATHIKPAFSQFLVQLLLLVARSSQCLQTPWYQLQSLRAPQSNSNTVKDRLRLRLGRRLRSLCSFKAVMLPNFNKIVRRELLIMGVQQLGDIFSNLRTNLGAWINTSDVGGKGCKWQKDVSPKDYQIPVRSLDWNSLHPFTNPERGTYFFFLLNLTAVLQLTFETMWDQKLWESERSSYASS